MVWTHARTSWSTIAFMIPMWIGIGSSMWLSMKLKWRVWKCLLFIGCAGAWNCPWASQAQAPVFELVIFSFAGQWRVSPLSHPASVLMIHFKSPQVQSYRVFPHLISVLLWSPTSFVIPRKNDLLDSPSFILISGRSYMICWTRTGGNLRGHSM